MVMFDLPPPKARKRRKGRKRMTFEQKIDHIIDMMTKNAEFLTRQHGVTGWGFNLSQIADMTAYERSTALMRDLHKACDKGLLKDSVTINKSHGVSPIQYWFYTPREYNRALKQGRLFLDDEE